MGKVKLNIDGVARGNPREAGVGCIIRDHEGNCLWALYGYIREASNNGAKLEVMNNLVLGYVFQNIFGGWILRGIPNFVLMPSQRGILIIGNSKSGFLRLSLSIG
ncbi:hypothetical protein SUGI_0955280 [Cryptomeria japonica]|nr:hypothetical protein SUGI_0955280 [Cryptomeria japonica]